MVKVCPGYEKYGIREDGCIVSRCRGEWRELHPSKGVISLNGQNKTTCHVAKFRYCVENGINPKKLSCIGAMVTDDGRVITRADFTAEMNKRRARENGSVSKEDAIAKLQKTIDMAQAAIDYINGNPSKILKAIEENRVIIERTLTCSQALASDIVAEAGLQLMSVLGNGRCSDPIRWLYKRSKGILTEMRRNTKPYSHRELEMHAND